VIRQVILLFVYDNQEKGEGSHSTFFYTQTARGIIIISRQQLSVLGDNGSSQQHRIYGIGKQSAKLGVKEGGKSAHSP